MIKRIFGSVATFILVFSGAAVLSPPAQAMPGCSSYDICMDDYYDGGGDRLVTHDPADRPGCFALPLSRRDRVSSIDNNTVYTDHNIRVYNQSYSCSGNSTLMYAGTEGNMSGQWYNSIDSYYVY